MVTTNRLALLLLILVATLSFEFSLHGSKNDLVAAAVAVAGARWDHLQGQARRLLLDGTSTTVAGAPAASPPTINTVSSPTAPPPATGLPTTVTPSPSTPSPSTLPSPSVVPIGSPSVTPVKSTKIPPSPLLSSPSSSSPPLVPTVSPPVSTIPLILPPISLPAAPPPSPLVLPSAPPSPSSSLPSSPPSPLPSSPPSPLPTSPPSPLPSSPLSQPGFGKSPLPAPSATPPALSSPPPPSQNALPPSESPPPLVDAPAAAPSPLPSVPVASSPPPFALPPVTPTAPSPVVAPPTSVQSPLLSPSTPITLPPPPSSSNPVTVAPSPSNPATVAPSPSHNNPVTVAPSPSDDNNPATVAPSPSHSNPVTVAPSPVSPAPSLSNTSKPVVVAAPAPSLTNASKPVVVPPAPSHVIVAPSPSHKHSVIVAPSPSTSPSVSAPAPSKSSPPLAPTKRLPPPPTRKVSSPPPPMPSPAPKSLPPSAPPKSNTPPPPLGKLRPAHAPGPSLPLKNAPKSSPLSPKASPPRDDNNTSPSQLPSPAPLPARQAPPPHPSAIIFPQPKNTECHKTCTDPYVTSLPGEPCDCLIPMRVGLSLEVPLIGLLPFVSEFAKELAVGTFLSQRQVQISAASSSGVNFLSTALRASLVPVPRIFGNKTATRIAQRLWTHRVYINETLFGNYTVLYIVYPGLPSFYAQGAYGTAIGHPGGGTNFPEQPLAVDVSPPSKRRKIGTGVIVGVTITSAAVIILSIGLLWLFVVKDRARSREEAAPLPGNSLEESPFTKRTTTFVSSSSPSSTSLSFASNFAYTGSVTTFSFATIEKATENFKPGNIVGEGGFGRVYAGVLEDQTKIAVKVLIRDDQQGDKEFSAEVEMLSRLHHRNLVTLLGICTEEMRCLVYELISNGSVETHLHGAEKPLTWDARMKIALGSARALAYLHEDCYPRVIHRDFKSSNILLEDDFTPKVSDFGLAKAASEELTGHISTRVMGTFGYVAPEYAMTGHLLVKSDVYSYGVVLLELLSGRRPVDMSRSPGQENLVTWARPLLTSSEGLQMLIDPSLDGHVSFDNLARVAAIASMCVQPEVSQRPFMSEVVQAFKLVCNDMDAGSDGTPRSAENGHVTDMDWEELLEDDDDPHPGPASASDSSSSTLQFIQRLPDALDGQSTSGPLRMTTVLDDVSDNKSEQNGAGRNLK